MNLNLNNMETVHNNKSRVGNFTSSGIAHIMSNGKAKESYGKPFYTYIAECNMERRLTRSLETESNARALTWGKLLEKRVFGENALLDISYETMGETTIVHPVFDCWSGSPDAVKHDEGKTVIDVKCPITLKSFCTFIECIVEGDGQQSITNIRNEHSDGEKYYWQLVSNGILTNSKYAELIVYCPYESELHEIKELASNVDELDTHKYMWIFYAQNSELPYLPDGGYYKNINAIRFEIPDADKVALTNRVIEAKKLLIQLKS